MYENSRILSVNSHKSVRTLILKKSKADSPLSESMASLQNLLNQSHLPWPQLLDTSETATEWKFLITAPSETLEAFSQVQGLELRDQLATVTATCQGTYASELPAQITQTLTTHQIHVRKILLSALSVTAVIEAKEHDKAVRAIHP